MLTAQVVPVAGKDAYRLLRDKVTHEAKTWSWANKAKTRLVHSKRDRGYVEVGSADGVLIVQFRPSEPEGLFFLVEKLLGRLTAWFASDVAAINLQFLPDEAPKRRRRRRGG